MYDIKGELFDTILYLIQYLWYYFPKNNTVTQFPIFYVWDPFFRGIHFP